MVHEKNLRTYILPLSLFLIDAAALKPLDDQSLARSLLLSLHLSLSLPLSLPLPLSRALVAPSLMSKRHGETDSANPTLKKARLGRPPKGQENKEDLTDCKCTCKQNGRCVDSLTLGFVQRARKDIGRRKAAAKKQWLVEYLRQRSVPKQKHMVYKINVDGVETVLCRAGFKGLYRINESLLNNARADVTANIGGIKCHGNLVPSVQASRGAMKSAIIGIARAHPYIQKDGEEIQTGVRYVHCTPEAFASLVKGQTDDAWIDSKLPAGDSRCRDKPPSIDLVEESIAAINTTFAEQIRFAKTDEQW